MLSHCSCEPVSTSGSFPVRAMSQLVTTLSWASAAVSFWVGRIVCSTHALYCCLCSPSLLRLDLVRQPQDEQGVQGPLVGVAVLGPACVFAWLLCQMSDWFQTLLSRREVAMTSLQMWAFWSSVLSPSAGQRPGWTWTYTSWCSSSV